LRWWLLPVKRVLHLICDLTIAADNAIFGQMIKLAACGVGLVPTILRIVGQKKGAEIWFLCANILQRRRWKWV